MPFSQWKISSIGCPFLLYCCSRRAPPFPQASQYLPPLSLRFSHDDDGDDSKGLHRAAAKEASHELCEPLGVIMR